MSRVTSVSPSCAAWDARSRSKGSRWTGGRRSTPRAWTAVTGSSKNSFSTRSCVRLSGAASFPSDRLMAISHTEAALTYTRFDSSRMASWAAGESDSGAESQRRSGWVSNRRCIVWFAGHAECYSEVRRQGIEVRCDVYLTSPLPAEPGLFGRPVRDKLGHGPASPGDDNLLP